MSAETAMWSIGDLARATDLAPATIRVWERRYGRPTPERLPSGHRRYSDDDVTWLRRIGEALANGHRPSAVIPLADEALDALLSARVDLCETEQSAGRYLRLIREYRDVELRRTLQLELGQMGPRSFILRTVAPLITLVGRSWADGRLAIRHEHFLTEILEDMLRGIRESIHPAGRAPVVLFATLPDEQHRIGLQMAAAIAALSGVNTSILGTDLPVAEIVGAAGDCGAAAVSISVSLARAGVAVDRELASLRHSLPEEVFLIVGGRGARGPRRGPRKVIYLDTLPSFESWLRQLG